MTDVNSFQEQYNFLAGFAKQQLSKSGEFYPFATFMKADGTLHPLMAYDGSEHPQVSDVINQLETTILALIEKGDIAAAGICINGTLSAQHEPSDAVIFELENAAGEAVTVTLPYTTSTLDSIEYGSITILQRPPRWFV